MTSSHLPKKTKYLLLAAALTLLALLAAFFLRPTQPQPPPGDGKPPEGPSADNLHLTQRLVQDITLLTVENDRGGYVLRNLGEGRFADDGLDSLPQDGETIQTALAAATHLTDATLVTDSPKGLAPYGLAPPTATVTIAYSDGAHLTVLVGAPTPDGKGTYFTTDATRRIYLADGEKLTPFSNGERSFVSRILGEGATPIQVSEITLTGRNFGEEIRLESIPTNSITGPEQQNGRGLHRMVSPRQAQADSAFVNDLIEKTMTLTALETVTVAPTPEEIAAANLGEPEAILTLRYEGEKTLTLRASQGEDGNLLLMKEGLPVLYRVKKEDCPWFDATVGAFLSLRLLAPNLESLAELDLVGETLAYTFTLTGEGENLTVHCNEQPMDPQRFLTFYTLLTELSGESAEDLPTPQEDPLLKIIYRYRTPGKGPDTIAFHPGPTPETVTVTVAGHPTLLLPQSTLTQLLHQAQSSLAP